MKRFNKAKKQPTKPVACRTLFRSINFSNRQNANFFVQTQRFILENLAWDTFFVGSKNYTNLFSEYNSTHPETSYFTQFAVDAVLEGEAEKRSDESTSYSQFIISVCLHFYHWRSRNPEHGVGAMDTGQSFVQSLSVNENYRVWFMH